MMIVNYFLIKHFDKTPLLGNNETQQRGTEASRGNNKPTNSIQNTN